MDRVAGCWGQLYDLDWSSIAPLVFMSPTQCKPSTCILWNHLEGNEYPENAWSMGTVVRSGSR